MSWRNRSRRRLCLLAASWLVFVVTVSARAATASQGSRAEAPTLPTGLGAEIVRTRCLACHGADLIVQQRLSQDGWIREVDKMIGWGAAVDSSEKEVLVGYLTAHFGARTASAGELTGSALVRTRCLTCHDSRLIDQQRLTADGWTRVIEKMIGWGADVRPAEVRGLAEDLSGTGDR